MLTQGTKLYIIDAAATGGAVVLAIECATSIDGLEAPRDQIESTCLESPARTYEPGMLTPGQMSVSLNFDPKIASHKRLAEMWQAGTKFDYAIGFSDGTAAPTLDSSDEFDIPTSRSFVVGHDAFVANVPLSMGLNALVTSTVSVQLSGIYEIFDKTA